jgi:hypothetical protein
MSQSVNLPMARSPKRLFHLDRRGVSFELTRNLHQSFDFCNQARPKWFIQRPKTWDGFTAPKLGFPRRTRSQFSAASISLILVDRLRATRLVALTLIFQAMSGALWRALCRGWFAHLLAPHELLKITPDWVPFARQ